MNTKQVFRSPLKSFLFFLLAGDVGVQEQISEYIVVQGAISYSQYTLDGTPAWNEKEAMCGFDFEKDAYTGCSGDRAGWQATTTAAKPADTSITFDTSLLNTGLL